MSREQFEKVVANAAREKMVFYDVNVSAIAVNGSKNITLYAAAKKINSVVAMQILAAKIGTSGFQSGYVWYNNPIIDITNADVSFDKDLNYNSGMWLNTPTRVVPTDLTSQLMCVKNIIFDDVSPLTLTYTNKTNADQLNNVIFRVWALEKTVA